MNKQFVPRLGRFVAATSFLMVMAAPPARGCMTGMELFTVHVPRNLWLVKEKSGGAPQKAVVGDIVALTAGKNLEKGSTASLMLLTEREQTRYFLVGSAGEFEITENELKTKFKVELPPRSKGGGCDGDYRRKSSSTGSNFFEQDARAQGLLRESHID